MPEAFGARAKRDTTWAMRTREITTKKVATITRMGSKRVKNKKDTT